MAKIELSLGKFGKTIAITLLVVFLLFSSIILFGIIRVLGGFNTSNNPNQLAVINIAGVINGGGMDYSSQASSIRIMEQLKRIESNQKIKGVILRINSPGGSSAASDAIYRELLRFKEKTKRPVVVSMGDVAASGGYYISMAADSIFANPATTTGSIGVIMQFANLEGLYDKLGIRNVTFKSGAHKDLGNPDRPLAKEEKEILQAAVDDIYQQFVSVVAKGRNMKQKRVKELADGRIYTGNQAKKLGLVDDLGTFYQAIEKVKELAGIEGKAKLIYYNQGSTLDKLLGYVKTNLKLFNQNSRFNYQ